mmetsp:Transcript_5132/g.15665  ORF Transcript_5132/g.15665 Transcript_5132/m.15665 type:complete len:252 (+) Transcript_5132:23-778(+)
MYKKKVAPPLRRPSAPQLQSGNLRVQQIAPRRDGAKRQRQRRHGERGAHGRFQAREDNRGRGRAAAGERVAPRRRLEEDVDRERRQRRVEAPETVDDLGAGRAERGAHRAADGRAADGVDCVARLLVRERGRQRGPADRRVDDEDLRHADERRRHHIERADVFDRGRRSVGERPSVRQRRQRRDVERERVLRHLAAERFQDGHQRRGRRGSRDCRDRRGRRRNREELAKGAAHQHAVVAVEARFDRVAVQA